jgi:hypothetical protein
MTAVPVVKSKQDGRPPDPSGEGSSASRQRTLSFDAEDPRYARDDMVAGAPLGERCDPDDTELGVTAARGTTTRHESRVSP